MVQQSTAKSLVDTDAVDIDNNKLKDETIIK